MSLGQYTDLVNPFQFMRYMGAVANGGSAAEPYLVAQAVNNGSVKYRAHTAMTGELIDERSGNVRWMHIGLRSSTGTQRGQFIVLTK